MLRLGEIKDCIGNTVWEESSLFAPLLGAEDHCEFSDGVRADEPPCIGGEN